MAHSKIDNVMHNISLDNLEEDFEIPVFEKRTKVQREAVNNHKVRVEKHSFKRFLAEQVNGS